MAPVIIDLHRADDQRDVVHRAVEALVGGQIVAFPTETVYGLAASALNEAAVQRLVELKHRQAGHPFTLAIKSADDAMDYVPNVSVLGRRLARRCWPGPVTLVFDDDHPDSLLRQLPANVRQAVAPSGTVGLRVPAHSVLLAVLRLSAGPLVLTSANKSGEPDAVTAQSVLESLEDGLDLVLDDGPCQYAQPSSVVRVNGASTILLRDGVINEKTLRQFSNFMILFVCTGNTCRSPMAEVLMRKRIADRLGCPVEQLEQRGVVVGSAGIAAMAGGRPTPEAVEAMARRQLDLSDHESQPLSDRLVRFADLILTMTRGHRDAIVAQWPEAADRTQLLCDDGNDVADPIGGPLELYHRCADQIDAQLERRLDEIDFDTVLAANPSGD